MKENALIKARTVNQLTGIPAIGDDTGLEVAESIRGLARCKCEFLLFGQKERTGRDTSGEILIHVWTTEVDVEILRMVDGDDGNEL